MRQKKELQGIFQLAGKKTLFTEDLTSGEYRAWDQYVSKLSAALHKGLKSLYLKEKDIVLYLGASTGTTVSHVSDIVGKGGFVFAVEISPTMARELVFLAEQRLNVAPILSDANQPHLYADKIVNVDWLYQDVAQKNQVEIFLKNVGLFLKSKGFALLALKARSVNVVGDPQKIFDEARQQIEKELIVIEQINLDPYQKGHCLFVCQKK